MKIPWDVIIVGGGPAGLNAAVVLGRCMRKVILFDDSNQRNLSSSGMHNYLTRDGILPAEFLKISNREAKKFGVRVINEQVLTACKISGGFELEDKKGRVYHCRKILLATGLQDSLPRVKGFENFYGKSIFHCPYCDAWEVRNKKLGVYAKHKNAFELAISLTTWTSNVSYFTDGKGRLREHEIEELKRRKIEIFSEPVVEFRGQSGKLRSVVLQSNRSVSLDALFFANGYKQHSVLVEQLGCKLSGKKVVLTNRLQQTNIEGVYVAGDAARDMHFVVVAAAEGAKAGVVINKELQKEDSAQS